MYGFTPTEEQEMLIDAISRYAKDDLRPAAHEAEEGKILPTKLIKKGWDLGVLQASIPEAYGGFGDRSAVTGVLAAEELAHGDLSCAIAVMTPALFAMPVLLAGSEDQKQEWIPAVLEAGPGRYTAGLIEPDFDFDPASLRTTATTDGDSFLLNGIKSFIPYASEAKQILIYAALDGVSRGFIIHNPMDGVTISERNRLLGLNALPLHEIHLEQVRIPKSNMLPGDFEPILAAMHVTNAAMAVGVAKAAFEYSRDYAKDREAFGVKIAQKQAIAFMLAEMATEIEASRLLAWEAAWKLDVGKADAFGAAYLASIGAADMAMGVTDRAVQILGGHGYIRDHPVEMWMREGRGFATFTGLAIV